MNDCGVTEQQTVRRVTERQAIQSYRVIDCVSYRVTDIVKYSGLTVCLRVDRTVSEQESGYVSGTDWLADRLIE